MRFDALLNEAQGSGMLPTSVAGGDCGEGNWPAIAGFCGPGSVMLAGLFLALIAPCGGRSGLPKDWACACTAAAASEPPAVTARRLRRDMGSMTISLALPVLRCTRTDSSARIATDCDSQI